MPLRDPIAAYNAATDLDAHLIANALRESGLEAFVIEDLSRVGAWIGGLVPELHKPQVWIERADIERAKPILVEYERQAAERRKTTADGPPITVICEECGESSSFPANQLGSVQNCPHCRAFVNVGDEVPFEGWDETAVDEKARDD